MKKIILCIIMIFVVLFTGCTGNERKAISVDKSKDYININLELNSKSYKYSPTFAVWIEDKETGKVRTLYITHKAAYNKWSGAKERPSALPVWDGAKSDSYDVNNVDSISGATPGSGKAMLDLQLPEEFYNRKVNIYIEANVSFDYNDYFKRDLKPEEKGYNDVNGQPSVVWKASIDLSNRNEEKIIPVISGHGHVLGENHDIDSDMDQITSAKDIFSSVEINYFPGSMK